MQWGSRWWLHCEGGREGRFVRTWQTGNTTAEISSAAMPLSLLPSLLHLLLLDGEEGQGHKRQVKREGRSRWLPGLAPAATLVAGQWPILCSSAWPSKPQNGRGSWQQWGLQHQVQMSQYEFWMVVKVMFCCTTSTLLMNLQLLWFQLNMVAQIFPWILGKVPNHKATLRNYI
jgi:hypothetical protein